MSAPETTTMGKILVIGGTGMLGAPVARQLAADGHSVRVLSRDSERATALFRQDQDDDDDDDPKIEVVQGNVQDPESLEQAMKGCTGIHINLSGGELERIGASQVSFVAKTKMAATIKRITLISGISTCEENAKRFAKTSAKFAAEQAVRASGIEYTIFRCTMFMETLPNWKYLVGDQPTKWHWIAAKDYASMVSKAYVTPSASKKILYVCGPGPSLTLKEAVDQCYIPICDPERESISTYPEWIMSIIAWLPGNESLQTTTIPKFAWLAQVSELGDPREANDLLGAPSTTVTKWCEDYNNTKART
jgi:uncharacterized protein YbjT (DUF2867 family)